MTARNLHFLLQPRSIAVIGASERAHSVGAAVMRNLLKGGFGGPILPVHATRRSVAGVQAYRDVGELPQPPDLALICTPPASIPGLVHSLGVHGTRAAAILTDGVEHEPVLAAARPHLMRILGPNSMGLLSPRLGLNASFAPAPAQPGTLAFVSQSGALLAAALGWAEARRIGFTHAVSLGDAADVDAADALDFLGADPATRAILLYLESVRAGRKFLSAARAASRSKPLIVMKSGRTPAGAEAAMRHTGAHPGDDSAFDAAIARAGMLRVDTIGALFEAAETLARMRGRAPSRLAIVTNAGGPAVVAADALAALGGELAGAPADLGGDAAAPRYVEALRSALAEPAQPALLLIHGPSAVISAEAVAEACKDEARASGRVLACWMGGERAHDGADVLREAGAPVYETPEAAVQAFVHRLRYRRNQEALQEAPSSAAADFVPDEQAVKEQLAQALEAGRKHLNDPECKALLAAYGIPTVHTHVATSVDQAASLAAQAGYPVALKVLSRDLEHRADVGGVMLNLENEDQLRAAARDIAQRVQAHRPPARLAGFTVQRMIRPPGAVHRRHGAGERTLRAAADAVFGMLIRLDGAVGLVPLNAALARDMLSPDARGAAAVAMVLERVSQLIAHHPEIVELEIDPLLVDEQGAMALEARARVAPTNRRPGEHLAISPYPRELEQRVDLQGLGALLRPVRPEDARAYAEFIERTDAPDMRFRFLTRTRRVSAQDLARYTQIDYDREMAFVALAQDTEAPEILGEVRIEIYPDGESAEFAILVRSDLKRRGLGRALVQKAIDYCRARGQKTLIGQILPENEAMIGLARSSGMEVELAAATNLAVAHLDLQPRAPEVRLF